MIKVLLVFAVVFIFIKVLLIIKHRYKIGYIYDLGVVKLKSYRSGKIIEVDDFPEKGDKQVSQFEVLHNTKTKYRLLIGDKVEIDRECPESFIFIETGCVKRNVCYQKAAGQLVADTSDRNKIIECSRNNVIKMIHNCSGLGYVKNRMYPCGLRNYCFLKANGDKHVDPTLAYYQYTECVDNLPELRECKFGKTQYFDPDYLSCMDLLPECLTVTKNGPPIFIHVTSTKYIQCLINTQGELSVKIGHLSKGLIDTLRKRKDCDSNDQTNMKRAAYIPKLWLKSPAFTKCIDNTMVTEFCEPNCTYADTQMKSLSEYDIHNSAEIYLDTPDMRCQTVFDENLQKCVPFQLSEHFRDGIPLVYKYPFDRYYHLPRYFLDPKDNSIKEESRFINETHRLYSVLKYNNSEFELPTPEDNPEFQGAYGRDLLKDTLDIRYFSGGEIQSRGLMNSEKICRKMFLENNPFKITHVIYTMSIITCLYYVPINIDQDYETTISKNKSGSEFCPKYTTTHFINKEMCSDNKCTRISFLLPTISTYYALLPYSKSERAYNDEFAIGTSYSGLFVRCNRQLALSVYNRHENPLLNFKTTICKQNVKLKFFVELYGCTFICKNNTTAQMENLVTSFKKTIWKADDDDNLNLSEIVHGTDKYNWLFFRRMPI